MNTSPIATWQVSSIWLHIWLTICLLWSQAAVGHLSWHLGRPSPEVGFRAKFLDLMTLSLENVTKWGRGVILPSLIKLGLMSLGCPQSDEVKPRGRAGWVAPVCADPTLWRRRGLGAFSTLCFIPSLGMWPWMSCLLVAGGDGRDGGECRTETLKLARVWRLGMWGVVLMDLPAAYWHFWLTDIYVMTFQRHVWKESVWCFVSHLCWVTDDHQGCLQQALIEACVHLKADHRPSFTDTPQHSDI